MHSPSAMARATATRSRRRQASAHADEGRPDTHVAGRANKRHQDVPQSRPKAVGTLSPRFCSCPFLPASPSPWFLPFTHLPKRQKHLVPVIPLETYLVSARHRADRVFPPPQNRVLLGPPTPASLSFVQDLDRRGSHGELSRTSRHFFTDTQNSSNAIVS
jgi:hypothetical protein